VSSTDTEINLVIVPPEDNGGVIVTGYKLWVDTLQTIPSYTKVYEGNDLAVVVKASGASLQLGVIYRFIVQAVNEFGDSDFSEIVKCSLGSVPNKPFTP